MRVLLHWRHIQCSLVPSQKKKEKLVQASFPPFFLPTEISQTQRIYDPFSGPGNFSTAEKISQLESLFTVCVCVCDYAMELAVLCINVCPVYLRGSIAVLFFLGQKRLDIKQHIASKRMKIEKKKR